MGERDGLAALVARLKRELPEVLAADRENLRGLARQVRDTLADARADASTGGRMLLEALHRNPDLAAGMAQLQQAAESLLDRLDEEVVEALIRYLTGLGSYRKEVQ